MSVLFFFLEGFMQENSLFAVSFTGNCTGQMDGFSNVNFFQSIFMMSAKRWLN